MRYTKVVSYINVLGYIWMPSNVVCASTLTPIHRYDIENMRNDDGTIDRQSIRDWLDKNAGDFSQILDFQCSIAVGDETVDYDWHTENSAIQYADCRAYTT